MATYYIATTGNDSTGNGSIGTPWKTFSKGLSVMGAGDTLYARSGTYSESITTAPSGTSWTNAITIAANPGDSVTIRPIPGSGAFWFSNTALQYLIIDSFIIDGQNVAQNGIKFQGSHHIRVSNCEIKNAVESGILLTDGAGNNEFINLNIHHNGTLGYAPPQAAYGMYIATANNLVEGSQIHDNVGFGIHAYSANAGACHHNVIRKNRIYNNGVNTSNFVAGLILSSGDNNIAYNNIINGNKLGLFVYGNITTNSKAYNNTIYGNVGAGIYLPTGPSLTQIKNNIVYANGSAIVTEGSGFTLSNNLLTNPLLANPAGSDFHLTASSPAIDAGITIN